MSRKYSSINELSDSEWSRSMDLIKIGGFVGDREKAKIVTEHYDWVLQRCLHILGNQADAHDAAQETALAMYKALGNFQGRSSIKAWLHQILRNECIDIIRKRNANTQTYQTLALIAIHEAESSTITHHLESKREEVHNAINGLAWDQREILYLRFFSELPIAEIGKMLGISLSATKMRLYRALESFSRFYKENENSNLEIEFA